MKKRLIEDIDLTLYEKTLENGLKIFILPKTDSNNIYVTFSTKFGSSINEFIPVNKKEYLKIPAGVAHFLEHKIFEQKDSIDPFTFFTNNGADANANTSNSKTTYLFSGPNHLKENLNYLLDFVQEPYFTDENVEKEKGIIEQEIKMYDDMPFWKLYDKTLYNVFNEYPLKYPIAGKVCDIKQINKEILYDCYNTFYHPSNMFLVITGNVDPNEVINIVEENQKKKKFNEFTNISIKQINEHDNVSKEKEIIKFDVQIPKVAIAYKINILDYDINRLNLYLNQIFDIKIGATSKLSERLKEENLINESISFETVLADKHIVYIFYAESNQPEVVAENIIKELDNLLISNEELTRKKRFLKSVVQFRSDNIYALNSKIVNNIIKFDKVVLNDYEIIDSLSIDDVIDINNRINLENKTITIISNT